jgi:hypothetical protein
MNEKAQKIVDKIKEQQSKMVKLFEKELKAIVKSGGPLVESIGFRAYTSYFCDGEACTYNVYIDDDMMSINGEDYSDWQNQFVDRTVSRWSSAESKQLAVAYLKVASVNDLPEEVTIFKSDMTPAKIEKFKKALAAIDAFATFLSEFDSDLIKLAFGDHIEVTVSKNGIEISEYTSHE